MVSSLLIKLGMFAVTLGVVFWIGWTLPNSFDRPNDLGAQSLEESKVAPAAAPKRSHQTLLDLNRATEQEFDALPGIGARLAERIIAYRQSVGTFRSLDELQQVKGIGMKKFERIRPLITVVPDSESVSRERRGT
ncbi:MAG: helix-hairpin-helix domain-containing protein [Nitrospira sp. CG24E]|nr:MAG: helix-hairpin-helix domain-containing protein [Nitrospira sp. CG24E]